MTVFTSAASSTRPRPTRLTRLLQRYPVTGMVAMPYLVLVLPFAIANDNPHTGFIAGLLALAVLGSIAVETFLTGMPTPAARLTDTTATNARYAKTHTIAKTAAVVSIVCDITFALMGGGTVFTQVQGVAPSGVMNVVKLPAGWSYVAVGLLVSAYLGGHITRRTVLSWFAALLAAQVVVTYFTARTEPLMSTATFIAAVAILFGIIRFRQVAVWTVAILLVWPTLFAIRNEIRDSGGVAVSSEVSADERLRFDLQVARADQPFVPVDVGQPGPAEMIRYGLVPRVLDADRPTISTGARINYYFNGNDNSTYTFLPLGTIYFLEGRTYIPIYYGLWALLVSLLLRARGGPGPVRISLFCLAAALPLGWFSTYPDSVIGFLQAVVAALPLFAVLKLAQPRRRPGLPAAYAAFEGRAQVRTSARPPVGCASRR